MDHEEDPFEAFEDIDHRSDTNSDEQQDINPQSVETLQYKLQDTMTPTALPKMPSTELFTKSSLNPAASDDPKTFLEHLSTLQQQAELLRQAQRYADCAKSCENALKLLNYDNKLHYKPACRLLRLQAEAYHLNKDYTAALDNYHRCVDLCQQHEDNLGIARSRFALGAMTTQIGDLREAERIFTLGLNELPHGQDTRLRLHFLTSLGRVLARRNKNNEAITIMEPAIDLAQELKERGEELRLREYIARLLSRRGDRKQAEELLLQNLELSRGTEFRHYYLGAQYQLGRIANKDASRAAEAVNQLSLALDGFKEHLVNYPQAKLPESLARMHLRLANALLRTKDYQQALFHYQVALYEQRHLSSFSHAESRILISILIGLSNAHHALDNSDKSKDYLKEAQDIAESIGDNNRTKIIRKGLERLNDRSGLAKKQDTNTGTQTESAGSSTPEFNPGRPN